MCSFSPDSPPTQAATEHWAERPVPCSRSCWFSILNTAVCTCPPRTPWLSLPLTLRIGSYTFTPRSVPLLLFHRSICIISFQIPHIRDVRWYFSFSRQYFSFSRQFYSGLDLSLKHRAWHFVQLDKNVLAACQMHPETLRAWSPTSCVILVTRRRFLSLMKSKQSPCASQLWQAPPSTTQRETALLCARHRGRCQVPEMRAAWTQAASRMSLSSPDALGLQLLRRWQSPRWWPAWPGGFSGWGAHDGDKFQSPGSMSKIPKAKVEKEQELMASLRTEPSGHPPISAEDISATALLPTLSWTLSWGCYSHTNPGCQLEGYS